MEVLILLMFVGVVMVALALVFFGWTVRAGSFQHADRLALLPLADDDAERAPPGTEVDNAPVRRDSRPAAIRVP